jgi:outer membrane immunogenic protein
MKSDRNLLLLTFAAGRVVARCLAAGICAAILVPQSAIAAASMDDVIAALTSLQKEVATVRKENAELRATLRQRERQTPAVVTRSDAVSANATPVVSGAASQAMAAATPYGMPARAPVYKAPAAVAVANWSGLYLGVNGGLAWSRGNVEAVDWTSALFDPGPIFPGRTSSNGIFGAQAGYNWQMNSSWLLGLEGDFESTRLGQSHAAPFLFLGAPLGVNRADISQDLRWLASIRGRVGVTWDMALLYATGGVAFSNSHYVAHSQNAIEIATSDFSELSTGWVAGAGVEYLVMPNWVLRAEYLYYGLNNSQSDTTHALPLLPLTNPVVNTWNSANVQTVRFGVSYLFGTR